MQPLHVVLLQSDQQTSRTLAALCKSGNEVHLAQSPGELRSSIIRYKAQVVVLDLELSSLSDVKELSQEFPGITIVCNHRVADEEMWTASLEAGAADCCPSSDTKALERALANSSRVAA